MTSHQLLQPPPQLVMLQPASVADAHLIAPHRWCSRPCSSSLRARTRSRSRRRTTSFARRASRDTSFWQPPTLQSMAQWASASQSMQQCRLRGRSCRHDVRQDTNRVVPIVHVTRASDPRRADSCRAARMRRADSCRGGTNASGGFVSSATNESIVGASTVDVSLAANASSRARGVTTAVDGRRSRIVGTAPLRHSQSGHEESERQLERRLVRIAAAFTRSRCGMSLP